MDTQKIGRLIAECRKKKGLTQKELADKLGITNKAVSKWETGQGLPDISILMELGRILEVPVDALLTGEEEEKRESRQARAGVIGKFRNKIQAVHLTGKDAAGAVLIIIGCMFLLMQIWYLLRGRRYQVEYIAFWMLYAVNAVILVFIYGGMVCIRKTRKIALKKMAVFAAGALFLANIAAGIIFQPDQREIISVSKDFRTMLVLKIGKEDGKAVLYRNRKFCFARPADVFPFAVKDEVKLKWLQNDVCTVTYEGVEDSKVHQYVAAYGDRGRGSYYYVTSAALGDWRAQGKYADYALSLTDGEEGGISVKTSQGEEFYNYEECLQYGTLAIVFPKDHPRWTLVLNEDCAFDAGSDTVKDGGTLTLCRVSMGKTAPVLMQ